MSITRMYLRFSQCSSLTVSVENTSDFGLLQSACYTLKYLNCMQCL